MQEAIRETAEGRLNEITSQMSAAAKLARRAPADITLIAVSKTRSIGDIEPLIRAGHRNYGENRIQEAQTKWPELKAVDADIVLHLIGQLQSNKAAEAVSLFDVIHSLDRLSLVTALGKAMREQGRFLPCFIQVNIGAEPQKGGCAIDVLPELLAAAQSEQIPVAGLMCLPPADVEPAPYFALLAEMAARHGLDGLSMGMSGDFQTATMLGATHIRVGTALFGERG
ncbi:YggS family pyridoxal phosphate-dependent enzyme [Sphingorhabdus contaminans]|uniref:YggS family pyridoxal phosphate-dependent enzyme n=1 Tax=Sphingorhabdus contaminans TaxID=1343899 RepID=UPI003D29B7D4